MSKWITLRFNGKKISVLFKINKPRDEQGYHYDMEIKTTEKLSGNEFQKLRKYLEDEGYLD